MYPKIQEEFVGKAKSESKSDAQIQRLQAQMAQLQAQLESQSRPQTRMYTYEQVQILLSCESINHVMEEFDLSKQKANRLTIAREYLLSLGEMPEFMARPPQQEQEQPLEQEEEYYEEEDPRNVGGNLEEYQGEPDKTMADEITDINRKMAELKKGEEKAAVEKGKSGIDKIKDFIKAKTSKTAAEPEITVNHEDLPENMG